MMKTNRFFTETGRRKRTPKEIAFFKPLMQSLKDAFLAHSTLTIAKTLKERYTLNLSDAVYLTTYLCGVYNNTGFFRRPGHYLKGVAVARRIELEAQALEGQNAKPLV